jgi:hypothetical protein
VVWACADDGGYDLSYSAFAPEYFVNKQYTPFFYEGYTAYYGDYNYNDNNNTRYNEKVLTEWYDHFNRQFAKESLQFLMLKASAGAVDSIYRNYSGTLKSLAGQYPAIHTGTLTKSQLSAFFTYLRLAKACENFTVNDQYSSWEKVRPQPVPEGLESTLLNAFDEETDPFIKERLWFQLVRYYYFMEGGETVNAQSLAIFNKYSGQFPKNLTYYRAMGYVAGYYYHRKNYALSNYLYSLCYDYAYEMKIPSKWSFHPQEEKDWKATLQMAKTANEKITLWHMLGMQYDAGRAIKEIAAINPKSDKLDLLLSRVINIREAEGSEWGPAKSDSLKQSDVNDKHLVEIIASKNNTAKPYFWNLAAGYLNFLDSNYTAAGKFYASAKKQLPAADRMVMAQYKLLDLMLYVKKLKGMDARAEAQLVEPLNWLADLRDNKTKIAYFRFDKPLGECAGIIGKLYQQQKEPIKGICFNSAGNFYLDSGRVETLINLLNNPNKTSFERVAVRYYPYKVDDLYYHQATTLVYKEELDKAIIYLKKMKPRHLTLPGNPFNSRLNDCHDCEHEAPQKQKFTPLSFVQTLQHIKTEMKAGKNVYRNALLLANAYYNITYYGNARLFYESNIISTGDAYPTFIDAKYRDKFTAMKLATRYYQYALKNAATGEQRARCTFMLSKCERNEYYNNNYGSEIPPAGKYFAELKNKYAGTAYYREVLHECGYFKYYINKN